MPESGRFILEEWIHEEGIPENVEGDGVRFQRCKTLDEQLARNDVQRRQKVIRSSGALHMIYDPYKRDRRRRRWIACFDLLNYAIPFSIGFLIGVMVLIMIVYIGMDLVWRYG